MLLVHNRAPMPAPAQPPLLPGWRDHYNEMHLWDGETIACDPLPGSPLVTRTLAPVTCPRCKASDMAARLAVPEPKPAEREVTPAAMVGDVWAGSVGSQYRITRVGGGGTPPHRAIVVQKGGSYTEAMLEGRAAP